MIGYTFNSTIMIFPELLKTLSLIVFAILSMKLCNTVIRNSSCRDVDHILWNIPNLTALLALVYEPIDNINQRYSWEGGPPKFWPSVLFYGTPTIDVLLHF